MWLIPLSISPIADGLTLAGGGGHYADRQPDEKGLDRPLFEILPSFYNPRPMHALSIALLIFCMRICDVSIGTVRMIFAIRGKRLIAAVMGVLESAIWIIAISKLTQYLHDPIC